MKDIFSELYKKVLSFFNSEAKEEENSKDTACNRLKLVLMQDRAKMEPALMEKMREEMIEVISKYVEIDKEALDLNLEAEGDSFALMLNIPVLRAKTREEVEAAEGIISDDDDDDDDIEEIEETEETEETEDEVSEEDIEEEVEVTEESEPEETETAEEKSEMLQKEEESTTSKSIAEEKPNNPSAPKNKRKYQKDDDL